MPRFGLARAYLYSTTWRLVLFLRRVRLSRLSFLLHLSQKRMPARLELEALRPAPIAAFEGSSAHASPVGPRYRVAGCKVVSYHRLQWVRYGIYNPEQGNMLPVGIMMVNLNPSGVMNHHARPRCPARSPVAPSPTPTIETPAEGVLPY